ncbi:MAG: hypothetical protein SFY92_06285 [Verrucomicrobiae bacterium]|nr:hypothetical protein [Verrucomicrobiae bacterium]
MIRLPARQVHLDFHTSEHIRGIGSKFDRRQFQKALELGHVNSVTVFAKCHHSLCYYPTKVGRMHPHLKFDLMGEQISACHEIGVRAPIYITVGWSHLDSIRHPDWCARNADGSVPSFGVDPKAKPTDRKPAFSWNFLCPSGGYLQHLLDLTEEICQRYPVDGFFYDICMYDLPVCHCKNCLKGMKESGLDARKPSEARAYGIRKWTALSSACAAIRDKYHPEATLFFNGQCNIDAPPELLANDTHFELEDLPTTWGGYNKFPMRSKVFHRKGKDMLGMSGKFHTAWGEFGGFKHPAALWFEAAGMVAFGARCSMGDQLHPNGEMDLETYRTIGAGYEYVREIEEYGFDGEFHSNLGVILSEDTAANDQGFASSANNQGVVNMLMESQLDYEVVGLGEDLSRFTALILTGGRILQKETSARLKTYVREGGKLLVLGEGLLEKGGKKIMLDAGVKYLGPARFDCDYLRVGKGLALEMVRTPFLNYVPAGRYDADGARVLADVYEPYFSRTYGKFCSHQNTPYQEKPATQGGAFQNGNIVFLPHPLGALYHDHGARLHRQMFLNALALIYKNPVVDVRLPSEGRINLWHQPQHRRYVLHLLYASPIQRGRCLVIEDIITLRDIRVGLKVPQKIQTVHLALTGKKLAQKRVAGRVEVTVPELTGHQILVFEY